MRRFLTLATVAVAAAVASPLALADGARPAAATHHGCKRVAPAAKAAHRACRARGAHRVVPQQHANDHAHIPQAPSTEPARTDDTTTTAGDDAAKGTDDATTGHDDTTTGHDDTTTGQDDTTTGQDDTTTGHDDTTTGQDDATHPDDTAATGDDSGGTQDASTPAEAPDSSHDGGRHGGDD